MSYEDSLAQVGQCGACKPQKFWRKTNWTGVSWLVPSEHWAHSKKKEREHQEEQSAIISSRKEWKLEHQGTKHGRRL